MKHAELKEQWAALVVDGKPTEGFWSLWRAHKEAMKAAGVVVVKHEDGSYEAALREPKAVKVPGAKLLTLTNIPTLGQFGAMSREEKLAWFKANEKQAKLLGLHVVAYGETSFVELRGISAFAFSKSGALGYWSNKQAKWFASALKHLEDSLLTVNQRDTAARAEALWAEWQALPLNVVKFAIVSQTKAGLAKYFSQPRTEQRRSWDDLTGKEKGQYFEAWKDAHDFIEGNDDSGFHREMARVHEELGM